MARDGIRGREVAACHSPGGSGGKESARRERSVEIRALAELPPFAERVINTESSGVLSLTADFISHLASKGEPPHLDMLPGVIFAPVIMWFVLRKKNRFALAF